MKKYRRSAYTILLIAVLCTASSFDAFAQFRGMGQSSFSSSSSSSRTYLSNGLIGEAIVEADYDTRSIIVICDSETNEHVAEIIKSLDIPVQQVLIKVVFLEVTYNDDLDFGLEGALQADKRGANIFETAFGLAAESRGGFYKLLESDVNVTLHAIAEKGKLEILSRPSILTRNNQEAVINVGKRVPFVTNVQISSAGQQTNTVEYEDIGIILSVTPFITQEGLVELILAPEISTLTDQTIQISENVSSPVFANRSADTVVVTPNGKTVVIGGMMEDNTTESDKKVPILGDIPLLGLAFQRKVKSKTKTELMIFLTPYVVEGPASLVDLSEQERNQSELIPQSFSEQQLDKFLGEHGATEVELNATEGDNTSSDEPETEAVPIRSRKRNSKGMPIQ